jgi:Protein of unknown function (DUF1161)
MLKFAPLAVLALACTASHASTCDELRAQIEGKIKAAGVANFVVTVADSAANAPGKVVGTCDRGAKKILYVQSTSPSLANAPSAAPASPPANKTKAAAKTPSAAILTECKDGSTSMGGNCKP